MKNGSKFTQGSILKLVAGLVGAAMFFLGSFAHAQNYPNRLIRVIVPIGAGGPSDAMGRMILDKMAAELKVPVVVENKPGAGGLIGAREVARAEPDGYTLMYTGGPFYTASPYLNPAFGVDMQKQFIPIAFGHSQNLVLVVNPDLPIKTLDELVKYSKQNKIRFGSPGNGSGPHLIMEVLKKQFGIDAIHIPYRTGGEATQAAVSGQIDATIEMVSNALGNIEAGKLVPIAVTGRERNKLIPKVPTIREFGANFDNEAFGVFAAPAGTPQEIIDKLHAAVVKSLKDPDLLQRLDKVGAAALVTSRSDLETRLTAEAARWKQVIDELGLAIK